MSNIQGSVVASTLGGIAAGGFVQTANNLSDVTAATARTNLGLGTAATVASGTFAAVANNLSDVANAVTARTNLGLNTNGAAPTPGSTVAIAVSNTPFKVYSWTAGETETVNLSGTHSAGQIIVLQILNDVTLARTITLGTGFKSTGVIVGTTTKTATAMFISDGTNFY